jgi:hypothetical protein
VFVLRTQQKTRLHDDAFLPAFSALQPAFPALRKEHALASKGSARRAGLRAPFRQQPSTALARAAPSTPP